MHHISSNHFMISIALQQVVISPSAWMEQGAGGEQSLE